MTSMLSIIRTIAVALVCGFLVSCTQTTIAASGNDVVVSDKVTAQRAAKKKALRERARAAKVKREAAFIAKRKAAFEDRRKGTANAPKAVKKKRKATKKVAKKKTRNKAVAGKKQRTKKRTATFVGGRSKGIVKNAPWRCVPGKLKRVLLQVSKRYGKVIVNSTHRSRGHNRRVGGKRRSYHLKCQAVDFRVKGRTRGLTRFLRNHPSVGGLKRYRSGYYHIDTGPRRTW